MGRNTTPVIIGTALLGLLAVGLTLFYFSAGTSKPPEPAQATATPTPAAVTHWVAQRTIYPRTVITRDMLIESSNTSTPASDNAIVDPSAVVGRLANRILRAGDVITADAVTSAVTRVIPANIPIPMGLRGVAVWVDPDQTEAGLVDVGDRVDVVVTHELKIEKQGEQVIVGAIDFATGRTIAQDVEVLAVDRSIKDYQPTAPPAANTPTNGGSTTNGQPSPNATPTPPPSPAANNNQERKTRVILAVTPADAQRIIAANRMGEIHLTIRNPASHDRFATGEAREYPSRVIGAIKQSPKATEERTSAPPQWPTVSPAPILPPPAIGTAAAPDNSRDVTVIRGTEKTRAIVPR
jgi:Flp pilus assembly protein CpaB